MTRPKIKDEQLRRVTQTCRLPRYIADWLDGQPESSGRLIEQALTACYDIKPAKQSLSDKTRGSKWIWTLLALCLFAAEFDNGDADRRISKNRVRSARVKIGKLV